MAAVHAGEIETESTACGQLITVAAIAELMSTAHEEKEPSAHLGDSVVSGDCLPTFGFSSLPKCGGWDSCFHGISGSSVASCGAVSSFQPAAPYNIQLFDEHHFIRRCAVATCRSVLPIFVHFLSE
eukprot:SAG31_NODE_57_length_29727_cov_12.584568_1_plen_126_part_00